jgi:hypothetical protein
MSINTNNRMDYLGNGGTATYAFNFKIFATTDLQVTVRDTSNVETIPAFSVSAGPWPTGGTITLTAGNLTSGYTLTIRRVRPLAQNTTLANQSAYQADTHENSFDHSVMLNQQQQDQLGRCLQVSDSYSPSTVNTILPAPQANMVLAWNGAANALINVPATIVGITSADSSNVTFTQTGTGAQQRSSQSKLRDFVSSLDFTSVANAVTGMGSNQAVIFIPPADASSDPAASAVPNTVTFINQRNSKVLIALPAGYAANLLFEGFNGTGTDNRVFAMAVQAHATTGTPSVIDGAHGETVAFFAAADRTGGSRPVWAANFVVNIPTGMRVNFSTGLEIDFNNRHSDCAITTNAVDQQRALAIVSGGTFKPLSAISVSASVVAGRWQIAGDFANYSSIGLRITQDASAPAVTGPALYLIPSSAGTSAFISVRYPSDVLPGTPTPTGSVWEVLQNGNQRMDNNVLFQQYNAARTGVCSLYVGGDDTWHFTAPPSNNILFTKNDGTTARLQITAAGVGLSGTLGFFGTAPIGEQTVAGAKGGNAALGSLITCLVNYGMLLDTTT